MGISLETSGIKVGEDKCFLVNLNADPALNELLVYYLKVHGFYNVIMQNQSQNDTTQHSLPLSTCCLTLKCIHMFWITKSRVIKQEINF